ncbi:hypothetical protein [uncultured phage]|nr:hypothetical protein [uncultured phage]
MYLNIVDLPGDSLEYETLFEAARAIKGVPGMTCELGVRRGGGSKMIIEGCFSNDDLNRTHICVDPYGNIDYPRGDEGEIIHQDYHNQMRNDCLKNVYAMYQNAPVNVLFFVMEDVEFFKRFGDGVPIYNEYKQIINQYALVHFDGPHASHILYPEIDFFKTRVSPGAMFVFDDILEYNHDKVEEYLLNDNWQLVKKGQRKASYKKL